MRILIVENHPDTLESMKLYLQDAGYEVLTSMTVNEAFSVLSHCECEMMICDIGLPDGTGWDLMERLKPSGRRLFAIAMSGFGMNADNARSQAAGFRHHLLKPFKSAELDKILAQAVAEMRSYKG